MNMAESDQKHPPATSSMGRASPPFCLRIVPIFLELSARWKLETVSSAGSDSTESYVVFTQNSSLDDTNFATYTLPSRVTGHGHNLK